MEITEIRLNRVEAPGRLRALVSVVFDHCFLICDMKVIEGPQGLFVAMPCRKATTYCPCCQCKNVTVARFCNQCGQRLPMRPQQPAERAHTDVAHPITAECRQWMEAAILAAYRERHGM